MALLRDGSSRYLREEIDARPWLGHGEDLMKILHVDDAMGQVVFLQRFGRGSRHLRHTHHCTAVAYTLSGAWAYDGDRFPQGAVAFEPFGSAHQAMTHEGEAAEVLVVLTAGPGNPRILELEAPDGRHLELDLAAFRRLRAMQDPSQWPAFISGLADAPTPTPQPWRGPPHL